MKKCLEDVLEGKIKSGGQKILILSLYYSIIFEGFPSPFLPEIIKKKFLKIFKKKTQQKFSIAVNSNNFFKRPIKNTLKNK